jgi:hypothetical protein
MEMEKEKMKEKEGGGHYDGLHIGKRSLWLMGAGALGSLAFLGLGKASKTMRPAAVCVAKEGYAFKEWVAGKYDALKEDVEDIVAEAVYEYQKDLEAGADAIKREKEVLEKIEKLVEARLAKIQPAKKEG